MSLSNIIMLLTNNTCDKCLIEKDTSIDISIFTIDKNKLLEEHIITCSKPFICGIKKYIEEYNKNNNNIFDNKFFLMKDKEKYGCINFNLEYHFFTKREVNEIKLVLYDKLLQDRLVQSNYRIIFD